MTNILGVRGGWGGGHSLTSGTGVLIYGNVLIWGLQFGVGKIIWGLKF